MSTTKWTPGPWRWELNAQNKRIALVGGRPQFDLTVIEPARWGMGGATLMIRDATTDGMALLHKIHERRDWIAPHHGRSHHMGWCANVKHPDMQLIAAAPELYEVLQAIINSVPFSESHKRTYDAAIAALAKARGEA